MTATSTSPANLITRRDTWQSIWRLATGDRLLGVALTGVLMLLAAAALLPQTPQDDSAAYARWLSNAQLHYGGAVGVLTAVGLFDVVHSIAFRILAGVLGLALLARLVDRVQDFRAAQPARPPDSPAQTLIVPQSLDEVTRRLRGYRLRPVDGGTAVDRFPGSHLGSIAAHAGPLIMLIGLALSPLTDWRVDGLAALPGTTSAIANTPYALHVAGVDASGHINLSILQGDLPVQQGAAAPGQPLLGSPVSVFVRELLPALRVTGQTAEGEPLKLLISAQSAPADELLLAFDANRPDEFFVAPGAQLAVRVSLSGTSSLPAYQVSVINSADATLITETALSPSTPIEANGNRLQFENRSHALVAVVHTPAQVIVLLGLIVAGAGLAIVAVYPPRRFWLDRQDSGTRVVSDDAELDLARLFAEKHRR